jgi:nucleoside-diphosphate kinase
MMRLRRAREAVVARLWLGRGAAVRSLLGPTNPAAGGPDTIRGGYATDSLARATADGRLIDDRSRWRAERPRSGASPCTARKQGFGG